MAKDTPWFPHDYNARADDGTAALITQHGATGYGIYMIVTEILHEDDESKIEYSEKKLRRIAASCKTKYDDFKAIIDDCIDFELWVLQDGYFLSNRVLRNKTDREKIRQKRIEAGKKGGEANALNIKANASKNEANGKQIEANSSTRQDITRDNSKPSSNEEEIDISLADKEKYKKEHWIGWATRKEIVKKKDAFTKMLIPWVEKYGKELCNSFWKYWTEPNKNKSGQLRWEAEKFFDFDARLRTFKKNEK